MRFFFNTMNNKKKPKLFLFDLKIFQHFITDVLLVRVIFTDINYSAVLELKYSTLTEQLRNNILLQMLFLFLSRIRS